MHRHMKTLRGCAAGLAILAALPVSSPARADTTVAQFAKMKTTDQAHLLGGLLQSLAEGLEKSKREKEAECLIRLYTNTSAMARRYCRLGRSSPESSDFEGVAAPPISGSVYAGTPGSRTGKRDRRAAPFHGIFQGIQAPGRGKSSGREYGMTKIRSSDRAPLGMPCIQPGRIGA